MLDATEIQGLSAAVDAATDAEASLLLQPSVRELLVNP
eukprot:COSAG02_NODE_27668_length_605_cov_0.509881_1_plen_37_part_10